MAGREYSSKQYGAIKNFGKEVREIGRAIATEGSVLQNVGEHTEHDPERILGELGGYVASLQRIMHDIVLRTGLRPNMDNSPQGVIRGVELNEFPRSGGEGR